MAMATKGVPKKSSSWGGLTRSVMEGIMPYIISPQAPRDEAINWQHVERDHWSTDIRDRKKTDLAVSHGGAGCLPST